MSQFENLLELVLAHEGVSETNPTGTNDDPNDPGGYTKWGISQRMWSLLRVKSPEYADFPNATSDLTREQAVTIYKISYYLPAFDELPPGPALVAFDSNVNEGFAIQFIQRAIGTHDDGIWGPASQAALRLAVRNIPKLVEDLLWQRVKHYADISKPSPRNQNFLAKLWLPRLLTCRQEAYRL